MTATQINKLRAYQSVLGVLEVHTAILSTLPAFAEDHEDFAEIVAHIKSLAQTQAARTGATKGKWIAVKALGTSAYEIAAAVHAYAVKHEDFVLEGRVDYSESAIVVGAEDRVVTRCRGILAVATEHLAELGDYGLTQARLTAFKKQIDAFETMLPTPRNDIARSSAATKTLSKRYKAADTILAKRLDKLAVQFKATHPDFYNAYQAARSIVDLPGTHAGKVTPQPEPAPQPQPA